MVTRTTVIVMMLGNILLSGMSVMTWGQEKVVPNQEAPTLGVKVDATYVSKYIWRGYDLFNGRAAFQPSVDVDLFQTGFGLNVWSSIPCGSGANQDATEVDYTVSYGTSFFKDEVYTVELSFNYAYYDFPRVSAEYIPDTEEIGAGISFPKLITLGESNLVPGYYVGRLWANKENLGIDIEGMYHVFSLSYDTPVPQTDLALTWSWDIAYNDGLFGSDNDWSHTTFGVSTSADVGSFTIAPFLNYQVSMDDSVNPDDELYGGVSVSVSF